MIPWLLSLALAGPEVLPRQAVVPDLPAEGVALLPVPPALRAVSDPGDGRDLLLLDADGRAVPFAVLRGQPAPELVPARRGTAATRAPLVRWPDAREGVTHLSVQDRPLDALEVRIPHDVWTAWVTVEEAAGDGWRELGTARVWRLGRSGHATIDLPPRLGDFRLTLETWNHTPVRDIGLVGLRHDTPPLPVQVLEVPVTGQVQENGWVRYDLPLPWPQPIDAVRPQIAEDLFHRQAAVVSLPAHAASPDTLPLELTPHGTHMVQRIQLGGAALDDRRVPVDARVEDRPTLLVQADAEPPLTIDRVELEVTPQVLVVRDAGPGPHRLLGGAVDPEAPAAQLAFAAPELRRAATQRAVPEAVTANPDHVPEELRSALAQPGRPLDATGLRWRRALDGRGRTRVALDAHVMSHARADLGDLRLVTDEGRQVPYLLRRRPTADAARDLPLRRREEGARTVLTVDLPTTGLHAEQLRIHTDAPAFQRRVTVARPRPGRPPQVLRTLSWDASRRPGTLGVGLHQRVGDRLEVWIDNGDDPALPIDAVDLTWAGWELVAYLPEGGAELAYGDPERAAPDYDFATLHALRDAPATTLALGAPVQATPPTVPGIERVAVGVGMGVLGLGLLALLALLVRTEPPADEAAATSDPASA